MHVEFCARLRRRERLLGTIVSLDSMAAMEIVCASGFDWIFVEAEHAPNGLETLARLLVAARNTPCLVRLPNQDSTWIKRTLDLGAAGIIVPQVNTVAEATAVADAARFTPHGNRGMGVCRANGYGRTSADYVRDAHAGTAVIVQAEHIEAAGNAGGIAAVDGIDGVLIGPYDLSASLGIPGQITDSAVEAAIAQVYAAFTAAGKPAGCFSPDAGSARARIAQGFSLIACGVDTILLGNAATALLDGLRDEASAEA